MLYSGPAVQTTPYAPRGAPMGQAPMAQSRPAPAPAAPAAAPAGVWRPKVPTGWSVFFLEDIIMVETLLWYNPKTRLQCLTRSNDQNKILKKPHLDPFFTLRSFMLWKKSLPIFHLF